MRNAELFDAYLKGELSGEEKNKFEGQLSDPEFARSFNEHQKLVNSLQRQTKNQEVRKNLREIHQANFGRSAKVVSLPKLVANTRIIAVAASTAAVVVLCTVAFLSAAGYLLKKQSSQITELRREVQDLKYSSEAIVSGITKTLKKPAYAPANYEGTGFTISKEGYIITSLHMVKDADSIFVSNGYVERCVAQLVHRDSGIDLAVLKVGMPGCNSKPEKLPYSFREKQSEVGEKVFTIGFPRKDLVYGEGSLSSLSGFYNDTNMYQISIPVNPGNSGGPLLDEGGNVIGIIRGKISSEEGTGFAVKSGQILQSLRNAQSEDIRALAPAKPLKKETLKGMKRTDQVRKIQPFVYNVMVYKRD
jgi:serine protease Do